MAVVFDGKCLFLLIMLTRISRCQTQKCSSNLTNIVVYEGSPASFERARSSQSVKWEVYPSSDFYNKQKNITNYDDVVVSPFNTTYEVTPSGLRIFNSTVTPRGNSPFSTAGLYVLTYQYPNNCTYGANLIVIRSGPECSYDDASEQNKVKLSCSVDFAESSVQPNNPVFTWKKGTSVVMQQQPIPSQIPTFLKRSTSQLLIDRSQDVTNYECQLTFSSTPSSPFNYVTRTAPIFTASCFSSVYEDIVFDGFKRYENNILKDSGGRFSLCYPPTLSCDGDMQFKDNFIAIQGVNMAQCYRPSDYNVRIGNGSCTVKNLTNSTLTCYPPEKKPQQTENDINNCGKDFAVIVKLGFKEYICSCLKYPNDDHTQLIIAATVGSFVFALVVITVILVVVIKYKKAKKQAPTLKSKENQLGEDRYTKSDHQMPNDKLSLVDA